MRHASSSTANHRLSQRGHVRQANGAVLVHVDNRRVISSIFPAHHSKLSKKFSVSRLSNATQPRSDYGVDRTTVTLPVPMDSGLPSPNSETETTCRPIPANRGQPSPRLLRCLWWWLAESASCCSHGVGWQLPTLKRLRLQNCCKLATNAGRERLVDELFALAGREK